MNRPPRRHVGALTALLALSTLSAAAATAMPADVPHGSVQTSATPPAAIPVHDVFTVSVPQEGGGTATYEGAVHAAYTLEHGTVLYWSLRALPGSDAELAPALAATEGGLPRLVGGVLADPGAERVLPALTLDGSCLCTTEEDLRGVEDPSAFHTMYTTFPHVTAPVIDVDVDGAGTIVVGVPVRDQPPEPLVQAPVTPLGAGWPSYPSQEELERALAEAEGTARDQVRRSANDSGSVRLDEAGQGRLISLDADVLFAWDKATISEKARRTLVEAGQEMAELGVERVVVVGHTDATGSDRRNDELSQERAEAVRDVLVELLPDADFQTRGEGSKEPVASNDDAAGRALNRRATIGYDADAGERR